MAKPSLRLVTAIKLHKDPAYVICQRAGIDPNVLSKLLRGIQSPKENDARLIAVGRVLGIPDSECFEANK